MRATINLKSKITWKNFPVLSEIIKNCTPGYNIVLASQYDADNLCDCVKSGDFFVKNMLEIKLGCYRPDLQIKNKIDDETSLIIGYEYATVIIYDDKVEYINASGSSSYTFYIDDNDSIYSLYYQGVSEKFGQHELVKNCFQKIIEKDNTVSRSFHGVITI